MTEDRNLAFVLSLLDQLPRRPDERVQGGVFRMPQWLPDPGAPKASFRPWSPLWVNARRQKNSIVTLERPDRPDPAEVFKSFARFCMSKDLAGYRPGTVELAEPALAEYFLAPLAGVGIQVALRPTLPAVENVLEHLCHELNEGQPWIPGLLQSPGVTLEGIRAFAEAARLFIEDEPFSWLTPDDLLVVEAPEVEAGWRHLVVLGGRDEDPGLGFFRDMEQARHHIARDAPFGKWADGRWWLTFLELEELPFPDADLWVEHGLPRSPDGWYPRLARQSGRGRHQRPNPGQLAFVEGLLRVLAETTAEELDAGRFTRVVDTAAGGGEYTLALPALLAPVGQPPGPGRMLKIGPRATEGIMADLDYQLQGKVFRNTDEAQRTIDKLTQSGAVPRRPLLTDREKAQALCHEAFESPGRRRLQLARLALELDPDCPDALLLSAEWDDNLQLSLGKVLTAMEVAQERLGAAAIEEHAGSIWGFTPARPYLHAMAMLVRVLDLLGRHDKAAGVVAELTRLDPEDHLRVRNRAGIPR